MDTNPHHHAAAERSDRTVTAQLAQSGFDGFLLDDHVPHMDGDSDWNHRGRAHAIGYMQGLIRMMEFTGGAR